MLRERLKPYIPMMVMTLPIVVQNLLSALVSSADVVMLSAVGQSAISAVSLATQYSSVLYCVFYGLASGVNILGSQYWGRKDVRAIELVQGIALRFSLLASCIFALLCLAIPDVLMLVFTDDPELIGLGVTYLRAAALGFVFWSISEVYLAALRSVGRVTISTVLSTTALVLNILLNGVFVYVLHLGVMGVGLATAISRGVSALCCMLVSGRSRDVRLRFSLMFRLNKVLSRDFMRVALPALGNDIVWGVAFSLYSAILGHLGSDVVSANAIVTVVRNFATVVCFALASAAMIWIGKEIGEDKQEQAARSASRFLRMTIIAGVVGGLLVLASLPFDLWYARRFAGLTDTAVGYLRVMVFINTYYVMGQAINTLMIVGFFRAGGDSRFGFICDCFDMWCYALPLGCIAAFVLKLPPMWVYFLLCTDEFVKWPWVIRNYRRKGWLNNITREYE